MAEAASHRSRADELETATFGKVEERLGYILMLLDVSEAELFQRWDTDSDGELDRIEFRQMVRKIGKLDAKLAAVSSLLRESSGCSDADIDRLFDGLDVSSCGPFACRRRQSASEPSNSS